MDLSQYTDEQLESVEKLILAELAQDFTPRGFEAFFELMNDLSLPDHHKDAIGQFFKSWEKGRGVVIEMFRGAAKTTVFTALAMFIVGHYPSHTGFIIQANGNSAAKISLEIATKIQHSEDWRLVFPHIVPDEEKGWAREGYFVKRTDIPYDTWIKSRMGKRDPTFFGAGYKSSVIIGKRPNWFILDDVNDENNTASEAEALRVEKLLSGTIFPAANMADKMIVIGTPWNENDVIHYCLATKEFDHVKYAVYTDGKPTWPEQFPEEQIVKERNRVGEIEYARMYLLDLSKTKGLTLKEEWLHRFPNTDINLDWPVFIGVDFTSTEDPRKRRGDYFALAVGRLIPGKALLVLEDGVRARLSKAEAEGTVVSWCARYPTLLSVGVEAIMSGNLFYTDLLNNAELRAAGVYPVPVRFKRDKGTRFEQEMAPLFQRGRVMIADSQNAFLRAFRDEWLNWQGNPLEDMYTNDTLDAAYALIRAAEGHITPIRTRKMKITNPMWGKDKIKSNPFTDFGRQ